METEDIKAQPTEFEVTPEVLAGIGLEISKGIREGIEAVVPGIVREVVDEINAGGDEETKARRPGIEVGVDRLSLDPTGGFKNLGEFLIDVKNAGPGGAGMGERLRAYCKAAGEGLVEGIDEFGGTLVPLKYREQILMSAILNANFAAKCLNIPIQTKSVAIPTVKDTDRSGGAVFGGIQTYMRKEAAKYQESKPTFGEVKLDLNELIGMCYISDEMLADSPISVEPLIVAMFGKAIAWKIDYLLLNGTGAGEPTGVLSKGNKALVEVKRQTVSKIQYLDIINLWARMDSMSKSNSDFISNQDCFPELAVMTIGASEHPVYLPANQASGRPYSTLFGRPIVETEHAQALGDKGDMLLVDWSAYLFGNKVGGGVDFKQSIHLKFDYGQTAFRFSTRFDGQPWQSAPRKPRHGKNTVSSFTCLAAEAA